MDSQVTGQQETIVNLQEKVDSLLNVVAACCQAVEPSFRYGISSTNADLDTKSSFILFQADPNPFQYSTDIRYYVPSSVLNAEVFITDENGRVVKRIRVDLRDAEGLITVYSSDLNSGIYLYSLVNDGRVVESKKMVCSK